MRALLALMLAALLALLFWQWRDWPPGQKTGAQPTSDQGKSQTEALVTSTPMALPPAVPREDYHSVTERPLFLSSRRPPAPESEGGPEPAAEGPPAPAVALDTMDLNAVIITPTGAVAWVRTPTEPKLQKVQVGDELEGWKIKAILPDEVEMEGASGADRLVLRRYDQAGQPAAPQSPPAASKPQARRSTPPPTPTPAANRPPHPQASAKDKSKAVPAKPKQTPSPPR